MSLVLLVLVSLLSQQLGASVAGLLFDDVGSAGMVALRIVFSAAVLVAVTRPSRATLAGLGRPGWAAVVGLGAAMTGMNLMIYEAFARIPQGVAVTFEVLGPLALSVLARPSWRSGLWAAIALAGIAVLGRDVVWYPESNAVLGWFVLVTLAGCTLWVRFLGRGPLEWLMRSLTLGSYRPAEEERAGALRP